MSEIVSMNNQTFEMLFKSHFKGLCYFAIKYVKDMDVAKEIVQDAFITFWEKRDSIDMSKSPKSYLTTAIYNKSLNYLRDNKKFNNDILTMEGYIPLIENHQPNRIEINEISDAIKNALEELPEKCREVFMLSRYENLKYQQIADQLGISIKTVETHMSKALQHMRVRLAEFVTILIFIVLTFLKK